LTDAHDELEQLRERIAVVRAQSGDREGFGNLVTRYQDRLMYYVHRLVNDREQSRDILQEIWLEVFRALTKLESPRAFRVWLYRIAHNRAMTHLRRRGAEPLLHETATDAAGETDAWNELELLENAELVHFALDRLSPAHREIMTLRFLEDMDLKQIARILDCSEGTAKSRLHYAKAALRRIIDQERGHA
jgi:RNA polymerase sigma-70 factor (ECF subfamily)